MRARQDGRYATMMHRIGRLIRTKRHWQRLLLAGVLVCSIARWGDAQTNGSENTKSQEPTPKVGDVLHDPLSGMMFVWIPKGCFTMGWISGKTLAIREKPAHTVCFEEGFWMGKFEVTYEQWQRVMGKDRSSFDEERFGPEFKQHPVEQISWEDALEFLRRLNEQAGTDKYRLPSEAQWEYAARAGTTTLYFFGDEPENLHEYAWYGEDPKQGNTHPVGQLKPNPWGLYDIYGNVDECCADLWHKNYTGAPADGGVWEENSSGSWRILRGGAWFSTNILCSSVIRQRTIPNFRSRGIGLRVMIPSNKVLHPSGQSQK